MEYIWVLNAYDFFDILLFKAYLFSNLMHLCVCACLWVCKIYNHRATLSDSTVLTLNLLILFRMALLRSIFFNFPFQALEVLVNNLILCNLEIFYVNFAKCSSALGSPEIFKTNERKIYFLKSFYFHKEIHLESVFFQWHAIHIIYKFMIKI